MEALPEGGDHARVHEAAEPGRRIGAAACFAGDEHAPGTGKPGHGQRSQRRRHSADQEEREVGPQADRPRPRVEDEAGGQEGR